MNEDLDKFFYIISSFKKLIDNLLSVTYLGYMGSSLELFNIEHWLEKKKLESSAFSLKSIIKQCEITVV